MDKVYVVFCEWGCNGTNNSWIEIFSTLEKATAYYKKTLEEEKKANGENRYDQIDVVDYDKYKEYCVYNSGRYSDDYYRLCLDIQEIDRYDDK